MRFGQVAKGAHDQLIDELVGRTQAEGLGAD